VGRVEYIAGFIAGSVALALLAGAIPRERLRPWGLAVGLAALATIQGAIGRRLGFTLAIALVAVGGWLINEKASPEWKHSPVGWILIVAGAFLVVSRGDIPEMWIQVGGMLAIIVAGSIMSRWASLNQYLVGPLFLITAFGIWSTVPETNGARGPAWPLHSLSACHFEADRSTADHTWRLRRSHGRRLDRCDWWGATPGLGDQRLGLTWAPGDTSPRERPASDGSSLDGPRGTWGDGPHLGSSDRVGCGGKYRSAGGDGSPWIRPCRRLTCHQAGSDWHP
jgi:hypothetical protein